MQSELFLMISLRSVLFVFYVLIPKYIHKPVKAPEIKIMMQIRPILMTFSVLFLIKFIEFALSASALSSKTFVISMLSLTRRPSSTNVQHCTKPRFILKIGFRRQPKRSQKRFSSKKKKLQMIRIIVSMTARIQNNNSGKVLYFCYLIR